MINLGVTGVCISAMLLFKLGLPIRCVKMEVFISYFPCLVLVVMVFVGFQKPYFCVDMIQNDLDLNKQLAYKYGLF